MGAAYVEALQKEGTAACAKHFACNNQETMRMSGSSNMDERTLREIYLPAFEAVVKKGKTRSLMCAYNAINGAFCAENKMLLTDILRNEWKSDAFVVTDWGAVKNRAKGVAAGLDLEMPGGPNATGEEIVKAVRDGAVSEADLDKAVLRLLQFVSDCMAQRKPDTKIDRDECRKLARKLAAECAVLMKNEGALPLKEQQSVVFIGEFARKLRYQGAGSSHINAPHPVSALEAVQNAVPYARGYDAHSESTDAALLKEEAVDAAKKADIPVIFAGLPEAFETEGAVTYAEGIFVGYRYYDKKEMPVNFCFGHGLSYTDFAYSNLKLDKEKITDQERLTVKVDVTNTGTRAGKTAVQLYVRDRESTVRRPVRELRAFEKAALRPGETQTVTFTLGKRAFAYWEPRCHDFYVESGEFAIEIGESSRDIRCSAAVQVEGTASLCFAVTENTTIGQLLKHPRGREIIGGMMRSSALSHADQTESMGEGSERMMQGMMMGIQLGALVSYGRMTRKQLKDLIASLNE